MPRQIIITGGDSRYFPLMQGTILSLADSWRAAVAAAAPGLPPPALGVLDCGLSPDEAAWCRAQGATVVVPAWDVTFAPTLAVAPSFRAMTARPHLRRYFPGFEAYLWIDADAWVQDWRAVALFLEGAGLGDIAIVPEVHRSYGNLRAGRDDFETANGRAYAEAFGADAAARLIRRPLNNAGVFALGVASPAWEVWARLLAEAAGRSANMIDQIALNVAIYDHGLREIRLPATCNWIAHLATPAWNAGTGRLVEPDPPFEAIGILHMTLATKWANALALPVVGGEAGAGPEGATVARPLTWPGAAASAADPGTDADADAQPR